VVLLTAAGGCDDFARVFVAAFFGLSLNYVVNGAAEGAV
jgi:hypothetical protein